MSRTVSGGDRRAAGWPSVVVLSAAGIGVVVFTVPGQTGVAGHDGTLYGVSRWALLVALAATGALLAGTARIRARRAIAAAGAIVALQLVGTGVVAVKHWRPFSGMTGFGYANLGTVRMLAGILTISAVVAVIALLVVLRRGDGHTSVAATRRRVIAAATGAVIAVGVPVALGAGDGQTWDVTSLGAYALLYSIPWGLGFALSGWLERPAGWAAHGAVGGSALVSLAGGGVVYATNPVAGFGPVIVVAVLAAARLRMEPDLAECSTATN